MARLTGLSKDAAPADIRLVLERQERHYGAALENHAVLARTPAIFRSFRAMWDGLGESAQLPARLHDLVNIRVASLIGCGL
jgi:alkylhydroperoxidase family enzyme